MVPTFIFSSATYFDPVRTPSKCGAVSEAVRVRPGAARSYHPTHAVAAIGAEAESLVTGDEHAPALGKGCALHKLMEEGGKVFLLGVSNKANSAIHIGEHVAGDPDRHKRFSPERPGRVTLNHPEKGEVEILLTSMMGSTKAFDALEGLLRERGEIVDGQIGQAACQLMSGQDVIRGTVEILCPSTPPPRNTEFRSQKSHLR